MLHVTNGDAAVEAIRSTGVDGEVLVWRDVLHEGPVPAVAAPAELRQIRASFLARCGWTTREEALVDLGRRDVRLEKALRRAEEIVLWFEPDLYDQLQLIQVLDRIAAAGSRPRITLVEPDGYLGLMTARELVEAYARARELGPDELELGARAWRAFCSEDPLGLERIRAQDAEALPALVPALQRHLEQFPGRTDGLSRSERQIVSALAFGALPFEELFDRSQRPEPLRFLGDAVFRWYLEQLAAPPAPLVLEREEGELWEVTGLGSAVFEGAEDRLAHVRIDRWLGGVRLLSPRRIWRWDPALRLLIPPD